MFKMNGYANILNSSVARLFYNLKCFVRRFEYDGSLCHIRNWLTAFQQLHFLIMGFLMPLANLVAFWGSNNLFKTRMLGLQNAHKLQNSNFKNDPIIHNGRTSYLLTELAWFNILTNLSQFERCQSSFVLVHFSGDFDQSISQKAIECHNIIEGSHCCKWMLSLL